MVAEVFNQQGIMTPLGASLAFVLISVIVSLIRQFFFHSSTLNANDDSSISLLKLHTLTIHQAVPQKRPYNSLYEAYYKPAHPSQVQSNVPYNSYALKRTVLNNEGVYLCDEYFAAIFQERTVCEKSQGECRWKTIITVYRLPFLKREFSKLLQVDGKILSNDNKNELTCTVKQDSLRLRYQINFAVQINEKESKKYPGWSMNSLIIQEEGRIWEKGDGPFSLKLLKVNLKNVNHYPLLYSFDDRCLSYVTQEEPWLVHYNCADSWNQVNVLRSQIQSKLFNANNPLFPTFSTAHQVRPLFMQLFLSTFKTFADSVPRQQQTYSKHFITYVFEITNSPFRFGKVVAQVTLALNSQSSNRKLQLVSYKVLLKNQHPDKKAYVDCSLSSKEHRLVRGMYTYQLGFGDDNVVASLQRHSLMCIFAYNYHEIMKVIEIEDLLRNFNISDFPPEISLRSRQFLEQKKMENLIFKRENTIRKKEEQQQENTWLDFDFFNFDYQDDDPSENETLSTEDGEQQMQKEEKSESETQKKERKAKPKGRREDKRRSTIKKSKKDRKEGDIKIEKDDQLRARLDDLTDLFTGKGGSPIESEGKSIIVPMPFALTGESKFKIIYGDPEFPLIYIEAVKKYLLAYHLKDDSDNPQQEGNLTSTYTYKYLQIGVDLKPPQSYLTFHTDSNTTSAKKRDFLQTDLDRFLLEVIDYNEEIMNSVKAISVVDAKYGDQGVREYKLKGLLKPYKKEVIVAWGWGLEVYEVNWDKKGLKTQLLQIEQQLNGQDQGIAMAVLLPFIELFATVYCLLQSLISTR